MKYNLAPIVLFVYNRPWHTQQTVEALQKNDLASKSDLIIYSDAPKNNNDKTDVAQVRKYLKSVAGFKSIKIIEREENWGLAKSIIDGVTKVVNQYGRVIVLEDDLVTSSYFLSYMNHMLTTYEYNLNVASIHGYIYPIDNLPETFFIKGADCWGWATWKNKWKVFEADGHLLLDRILANKLHKEFDFNGSYPYTNMLKQQVVGRNDSWAIRWYASAFLQNMLTLYPGQSFVRNIGHDSQATHTKIQTDKFDVSLNQSLNLSAIEVVENLAARKKIEEFFKSIRTPIYKKLLNRVFKL